MTDLEKQLYTLIESTRRHITDDLPADWYEKHMVMPRSNSFKGNYSYNHTPYWREVANRFYKYDPARKVAVMKGGQVGYSTGVIMPFLAYVVSQDPGPMVSMTGHSDLVLKMVGKVDQMLAATGLKRLIQPAVVKEKNNKSGDTDSIKQFGGGSIEFMSSTNHNMMRQQDYKFGSIDDTDGARSEKKDTGSTTGAIEHRFASHYHHMKLLYGSTPQLKATSIIEPEFLKGDQRYYNVPCPACHEMIVLKWKVQIDEKETGGIHWELDNRGKVIDSSVGYVCQKCAGFFKNSNKMEMNMNGIWVPTATPMEDQYYSYHLSALYAPIGMYDWARYARKFVEIEADPINAIANTKTHVNLCLGETYDDVGEAPKATDLMMNIRGYQVDIVPNSLSRKDGNGDIIMLTCAADLNGRMAGTGSATEDDVRLDYEIVAWSENGSSYSIRHGSIGTFESRKGGKEEDGNRVRWTYNSARPNNVWTEFDKVLDTVFHTDTGTKMKVFITGLDSGFQSSHAYAYIDRTNHNVYALKTNDTNKALKFEHDQATFIAGKERDKLYIVRSIPIKDSIVAAMRLKWDDHADERQPSGFMNFPQPKGGLYDFKNFFSHYEAEERVTEMKLGKAVATRWQKKDAAKQNHMWDCRVYNIVIRDICTWMFGKEMKYPKLTWKDFADISMGRNFNPG